MTHNSAPSAFFDSAHSADIVNGRVGRKANPRLREIMAIVVRHLHAATQEAAITPEEWMAAIHFLTDTGHMCDQWRQEFILLSDVLGVSMLVDAINHQRPTGSTENTVLGPFYVPNAPRYRNGDTICRDGKGEELLVRGRVVDGNGQPIAGAIVDVWQANADGFYDVQQRGIQPEFNLRGVFETNEAGKYWFRTSKPRWYPIPDDGPVGQMLAALDRHPYRAAHIHFIVSAPGFETVVTHIFTPDCPYLSEDAVFGVKQSLVADFRKIEDSAQIAELGFRGPGWEVNWEFVMAPHSEKPRVAG